MYEEVDDLWNTRMNDLQKLLTEREIFQAEIDRCMRWLKECDVITFPQINLSSSLDQLDNQLSRYEVDYFFVDVLMMTSYIIAFEADHQRKDQIS